MDPRGDGVPQTGFLGTAAPWTADVTLLLELALGVGLVAGALLARAGRYRTHAACQSIIVLLNLVVIGLTMLPSFHRHVLPKLPSRIGKPYYALAAMHAALGGIAEFGGLVHPACSRNNRTSREIPPQALQILDARSSHHVVGRSFSGSSNILPLVHSPKMSGWTDGWTGDG